MKIAVIAANGRSGQVFVEAALAKGHTVRAGVHLRNHLKPHPNLTVVDCDATNKRQLMNFLVDQEAVASFIGHVKGSHSNVQTVAIQEIAKTMKSLGINRIVSLTGTGVRFKGDNIGVVDRILNIGIKIIDPKRINDGKQHVEVLKTSDLNWTVIRVLKLQNVAPRAFTLLEHGPTKLYVGRQEVAQAVLQVLEDGSFAKQAPIITKSDRKVLNSSTLSS